LNDKLTAGDTFHTNAPSLVLEHKQPCAYIWINTRTFWSDQALPALYASSDPPTRHTNTHVCTNTRKRSYSHTCVHARKHKHKSQTHTYQRTLARTHENTHVRTSTITCTFAGVGPATFGAGCGFPQPTHLCCTGNLSAPYRRWNRSIEDGTGVLGARYRRSTGILGAQYRRWNREMSSHDLYQYNQTSTMCGSGRTEGTPCTHKNRTFLSCYPFLWWFCIKRVCKETHT